MLSAIRKVPAWRPPHGGARVCCDNVDAVDNVLSVARLECAPASACLEDVAPSWPGVTAWHHRSLGDSVIDSHLWPDDVRLLYALIAGSEVTIGSDRLQNC